MRILLTAAAVVVASVASVNAERVPLVLLVNIAEYFDDVYVADRAEGTDYLFFVGEPIRLDIQVFNADGASEHTVMSRASTAAGAISVTARRDGQPTDVGLVIAPAVERHESVFRIPVDWGNVRLDPKASLHWKATLAQTLPAGAYIVDFAISAADENAQAVAPHAPRFRFEVREPSPETLPEIIRRKAVRAYLADMFDLAEREARALLRVHPNSLHAYALLGRVAKAQGRASDARAAFERALALARGGTDIRQREMSPSAKSDTIESLIFDLARVSAP